MADPRSITHQAVKNGIIKRQPCEVCGAHAQAHHVDYTQPLKIKWLCRKHHHAEHVRLRKAGIVINRPDDMNGPLMIRIEVETRDAIKQLAESERRTFSQMARIILEDGVKRISHNPDNMGQAPNFETIEQLGQSDMARLGRK